MSNSSKESAEGRLLADVAWLDSKPGSVFRYRSDYIRTKGDLASDLRSLLERGGEDLEYAKRLATVAASKFGPPAGWAPLSDMNGVLSQIDNALTGLPVLSTLASEGLGSDRCAETPESGRADGAPSLTEGAQAALDYAWRGIDACGGTYSPEEEASGYADAHRAALEAACAAVEALGGQPS